MVTANERIKIKQRQLSDPVINQELVDEYMVLDNKYSNRNMTFKDLCRYHWLRALFFQNKIGEKYEK